MMYVPFCLFGSSRCHIKQSNRSMVNGINGKRQCLFPFGYEAKSTCPLDGKVNMARNPVMFTALKFSLKISMPFRWWAVSSSAYLPYPPVLDSCEIWWTTLKNTGFMPRAWWAMACHLQDGKPLSSLPAPPTDPALDVGTLRWRSSNRIHMDPPSSNYHTYRYIYIVYYIYIYRAWTYAWFVTLLDSHYSIWLVVSEC